MLAKILGTIWILFGAFWVLKPKSLKERLSRKMNKKIHRVVLFFMLIFCFLMVGSVFKAPGFIPKVIGIVGMIIAIKVIMLLTSKTSEKLLAWWGDKPLIFYRILAVFIVSIGLGLVFA